MSRMTLQHRDSSEVLREARALAERVTDLHKDTFFERLGDVLPTALEGLCAQEPTAFIELAQTGTAMELLTYLTGQTEMEIAEAICDTAELVGDLEEEDEGEGEEEEEALF